MEDVYVFVTQKPTVDYRGVFTLLFSASLIFSIPRPAEGEEFVKRYQIEFQLAQMKSSTNGNSFRVDIHPDRREGTLTVDENNNTGVLSFNVILIDEDFNNDNHGFIQFPSANKEVQLDLGQKMGAPGQDLPLRFVAQRVIKNRSGEVNDRWLHGRTMSFSGRDNHFALHARIPPFITAAGTLREEVDYTIRFILHPID